MAKLVEILARELEEWPHEWPKVGQACDGSLHGEPFDGRHTESKYSLCDRYIVDVVTRTQWQAAVDALKSEQCAHLWIGWSDTEACELCNKTRKIVAEWNGEGLPPVGGPYEYNDNFAWCACDVIAYANGKVVFTRPDYSDAVYVADCDEVSFRPIRTPEQIAAEEREKAACDLYCTINWQGGVPEWDNQTTARKNDYFKAIDAGYRKQEQK